MRILCVIPAYWPAFTLGGPIFSVHSLNRMLVKKGIDVSVYTTAFGAGAGARPDQEVLVDNVKVTYFNFSRYLDSAGLSGWQYSRSLTVSLKNNLRQFDLVYIVAVWNYPCVIAAHYCRKYNKPYIISPRGLLYPYTAGRKSWKKWPYWHFIVARYVRGASLVHYTTEDERQKCHLSLGLTNRTAVVPNGVEFEVCQDTSRESFLKSYPELKGKKIILFLGRINWKKGLDILLQGYARLCQKRADVHLLIAGSGEKGFMKRVQGWAIDYKLVQRVTFCGMLSGNSKLEAYSAADVFVLPSYSENFGLAAVEAMSYGLPVIISDQVGIFRDVQNARAGIVIKTNAKELAQAVNRLLDDAQEAKCMGENGRRLVNEKYRLDIVADQMIKVYQGLLHD